LKSSTAIFRPNELPSNRQSDPIPAASAGVGIKPAHYRDVLSPKDADSDAGDCLSNISFFEVHAENYMGAGGPPHAWLTAIRERFPISVHGVCLSLGGYNDLDEDHLERLRAVVDRYEPALVSEHFAWAAHGGVFFNDLLAPPLSEETLARTINHVDQVQAVLKRPVLVENPSHYLPAAGEISEPDFLNALARRSGCGLLLDVNNIYVSARNLGFDADAYLDAIDPSLAGEIHLAGHALDTGAGVEIRVDDHGSPVCDDVGALYRRFIAKSGPRPTLIEWDTGAPDMATLNGEAGKAVAWMASALDDAAAGKHQPVHAYAKT